MFGIIIMCFLLKYPVIYKHQACSINNDSAIEKILIIPKPFHNKEEKAEFIANRPPNIKYF